MIEGYVKLHGDNYAEEQWLKFQGLREWQKNDSYATWQLTYGVRKLVGDSMQEELF